MEAAALVIALVAFVFALAAWARAGMGKARVDELETDLRRRVQNVGDETERALRGLREMVAALAAGEELTRDMVLEGRAWREVEAAGAARMLAAGGVRLVDVRTPQETAGGILPGALCVPIDELEARVGELPRDGRTTLVYCAGGGRSAAACEFLASQGIMGLVNLAGGISAWTGPIERPPTRP
jgi:rhodanese-related sulfurtransferase